ARVGAVERAPVPPMAGIVHTALRLRARTWSGPLFPAPARYPLVEMPARAVEQREKAFSHRRLFASIGKLTHERQLLVIEAVDLLCFGHGLADHLGELAHAGAVDFAEVGALRAVAVEHATDEFGHHHVEVGARIIDVTVPCFSRAG